MAKNYTTRTAALRATTIDGRQIAVTKKIEIGSTDTKTVIQDGSVSAEDMFIAVDGQEERQSVKSLIKKAQDDAVEAAGIQVTRDLTGDYDNADTDEVLSVKTKKMNFFGSFVNVVQSTTNPDEISIYIGENKNPAEFSTVTGPNGSGMYLYTAANGEYSLGAATAGSKYATCQTGGTETVYAGSSDTVLTIPNTTSTVKVEAVDNSGATIVAAETEVIDGSKATVEASNGGIAIKVYEIHKNTADDAKDGMTPGFIRCKVQATLTNATIMPAGGFYKVKMTVAGKSNTNSTGIFIYNAGSSTPSVDSVTAEYTSTGTKTVSGITYDSGAKVVLNVSGIKNTQSMATNDLNRVSISDNSNGRLADIGAVKVADLTAANDTVKTAANAEYSYSKEITFTASHTPAIMSGKYIATPYTWNNTTYANGKAEGSFAGEKYLWNGAEGTENDATSSFHVDGKRLAHTVLTDASGNVTGLDLATTATYDSDTSLVDGDEYAQQLLVQGGSLMQPAQDTTKTYTSTNCTGIRYWTKLIKTDVNSGDAHTVFTITGTNMTASGVKLWAVCANTDAVATAGQKVVLLNATGANGGVATNLSGTSITAEIKGGVMTCKKNSAFYLVVQLPANSTTKLGAITVANG